MTAAAIFTTAAAMSAAVPMFGGTYDPTRTPRR